MKWGEDFEIKLALHGTNGSYKTKWVVDYKTNPPTVIVCDGRCMTSEYPIGLRHFLSREEATKALMVSV
jgi:hypothetical protein